MHDTRSEGFLLVRLIFLDINYDKRKAFTSVSVFFVIFDKDFYVTFHQRRLFFNWWKHYKLNLINLHSGRTREGLCGQTRRTRQRPALSLSVCLWENTHLPITFLIRSCYLTSILGFKLIGYWKSTSIQRCALGLFCVGREGLALNFLKKNWINLGLSFSHWAQKVKVAKKVFQHEYPRSQTLPSFIFETFLFRL